MIQSADESRLKFKYINFNRIGIIFFMILFDLFLFFGFICNYYDQNEINNSLIWYYQLFFKVGLVKDVVILKDIPVLMLILIFIGYTITKQEEISLKGVKYSLSFVPITLLFSIIWYWINKETFSGEPFVLLFGRYQGYITILLTLGLILFGSYLGLKVKQYRLWKRNIIIEKE